MEANAMPVTVEDVFEDYRGRREGMIKALTAEVQEFYQLCDPDKENLCLYSFPKGTWEVSRPADEVPPELPEPALGINFARDGMEARDWLSLVAVHSDSWLYAVAFYFCARFNKQERKRVFDMINELPTVFEVVSGRSKEKSSVSNGANKSKSNSKKGQDKMMKQIPVPKDEDEEGLDEEEGETYCGACEGSYSSSSSEFWILCDLCERWYHGKCVKITAARAEHIKQYKCPSCLANKRARP